MTDRIDHATEAMNCVIYANSPKPGSPEVAANFMAQAQVHATLALVEQQRIANLIALGRETDSAGLYDGPFDEVPTFRLKPDIARALGLEVSND